MSLKTQQIRSWRLLFVFGIFYFNFFPSAVEDLYENVNDREIRQVFEGQNQIHLEIKQLNRQLAMILDEQRRYMTVVTNEISKSGANAGSAQVGSDTTGSNWKKSAFISLSKDSFISWSCNLFFL